MTLRQQCVVLPRLAILHELLGCALGLHMEWKSTEMGPYRFFGSEITYLCQMRTLTFVYESLILRMIPQLVGPYVH